MQIKSFTGMTKFASFIALPYKHYSETSYLYSQVTANFLSLVLLSRVIPQFVSLVIHLSCIPSPYPGLTHAICR